MVCLIFLIFITSSTLVFVNSVNHLPICHRDDPNTNLRLVNFLNDLKPYIKEGIPEFGLPSFDPLEINNVTIKHSSADGHFTWYVHTTSFYYLHDFQIINLNHNENAITLDLKLEKMYLTGTFLSVGELFGTALNGEGSSKEWYGPISMKIEILYDIVEKNEVEFCNILNVKYNLNIKSMYASVRGLEEENGDVNEFLNSDSKKMCKFLDKIYETVFEALSERYLKKFCKLIPYSKLFPKEQ